MTIAVAVRTQSAVIFASDSKLIARGLAGINPDGSQNWVDQTYDNATKVVHDRLKRMMVLAAGDAIGGRIPATDFIGARAFPGDATREEEGQAVGALLDAMDEQEGR